MGGSTSEQATAQWRSRFGVCLFVVFERHQLLSAGTTISINDCRSWFLKSVNDELLVGVGGGWLGGNYSRSL